MTDYDYYLVDCSGRSGALKVAEARLVAGCDVLGFLWDTYQKHCVEKKRFLQENIKWHEEHGNHDRREKLQQLFDTWMQNDYWYDTYVKCYPIAHDGSIVKDHSVMREIWLSYEGEAT